MTYYLSYAYTHTLLLIHRVHGINELLQLLRSRHMGTSDPSTLQDPFSPPTTPHNQRPSMSLHFSVAPLFHMLELQEDVVTSFLAGKPFIMDVASLRSPFKFKVTAPGSTLHPAEYVKCM